MGALVDLTGKTFGRLTVRERAGTRNGQALWSCACACGATTQVVGYHLRSGDSQSCGCRQSEMASAIYSQLNKSHGASYTREYKSWQQMRDRCGNPNHHAWALYGGRGVKVCQEWRGSFDRIDTNGDYEPGNCRWATALEQNRNRRSRSH